MGLETLAQDVRHTLRQWRRTPLFTLTVVATLALGIGANTAIFTLVQATLLRRLPVAHPSQLVRIGDSDDCCVDGGFAGSHGDFDIFSYALYRTFVRDAPEFQSLAAVQAGTDQWSIRRGRAPAIPLHGELVSGNYFTTLGLAAYAGRLFSAADDHRGAPPVAVISYRAWEDDFGGDRGLVGATLTISAQPFTVIGIAPRGFFGDRVTATPPALWVPLADEPRIDPAPGQASLLDLPTANWLYPIGRVRPGTSLPALQAHLSAILRAWLASRPEYTRNGESAVIPREHVEVVSAAGGVQNLQQETGAGLDLLMILSAVVLLIACANVANVLLARGTARRAEDAVRMALGENRGRLVRRLLTESVLLAAAGGVAGLGVAYAGARLILALAFPMAHDSAISATPDAAVLLFTFAASLVTGVLFGLVPAWAASHTQPAEALRGAGRSVRDRATKSQALLLGAQTALSLVLVAGALLTARSLANLQNQDFGVKTARRWVVHIDPAGAGYAVGRLDQLDRTIEDRFGALPGMASVGLAMYSPLEGDNWGECVIPQGKPAPGPNSNCGATWERVSPGFLRSVGVPILEGRGLRASDDASSQLVAVVNQAFVRRFFPHQDPIGQHFGIDYPQYSSSFEIVGVFRNFKMNNPRRPVRPVFLRPLDQVYAGYTQAGMKLTESESQYARAIVLAFAHPQPRQGEIIRQTLAAIDPAMPIVDLRSFASQVAGNFDQDRLLAGLASLFGALALVLASVGLYGVTAYLVARRTSEIGIRMALGASRGRIVGMVFAGVGLQVLIGVALGVPASVGAARLMAHQLYGVAALDPWPFALAVGALAACAALAAWIPARRAAAIDPTIALRGE
jgi:predicted permease